MSLRTWIVRVVLLLSIAAPAAAADPGIDGRWVNGGHAGFVIEFGGGRYQVFENGKLGEQGGYSLDGESITLAQDRSPEKKHGRFARDGDLLLIEPDDDAPILLRGEGASAAAGDPAAVEGDWQAGNGELIELHDGKAQFQDRATQALETGSYRVDGDRLTMEGSSAGQMRHSRWARVGERLVLENEDSDEVVVLRPVAATVPDGTGGEVGAVSDIEGRWIADAGHVVAFAGGAFTAFEKGQQVATGGYSVEGETLVLSMEGRKMRARMSRAGDAMLIEPEDDSGDAGLLVRETPSGAAAPDPAGVVGRWRNDKGMGAAFDGSHYIRYRDGAVAEEGSYQVENTMLVLQPQSGGDEQHVRWARFGDRLALEPEAEDKAIVLTAAVDPGPQPDAPPQVPSDPAQNRHRQDSTQP